MKSVTEGCVDLVLVCLTGGKEALLGCFWLESELKSLFLLSDFLTTTKSLLGVVLLLDNLMSLLQLGLGWLLGLLLLLLLGFECL